jgi:hypothetical protein
MPDEETNSSLEKIRAQMIELEWLISEMSYKRGYLKGFQDTMELCKKNALEARKEKAPF